jgi:polar amino acid transport system permease protein
MSSATQTMPDRGLAELAGLTIVPKRFYGRWVAAAAILFVLAWIVKAFAQGQIAWPVVAQFFTAPAILAGLVNTLIMTVCAMGLGIVLGVVFAIMYMSPNPVLRGVALFFIWFFRGTPLLVQLIFWYNLSTLVFPRSRSIPFGPTLVSWHTNDLITPMTAAIAGSR